ncbi:UTP--glucose-1-phosphate uridylyltransferase [Candidatus Odyssella thessalonicensis]|uniref:UTP--glucose-1-phosphate uridylyltransferase n=1 Tax=Candidatus Odyssella thessalonicensis TaxID=84647 RepID=UPI000225AF0E|nr:UTP--glucose-1-phosphate uridylyltransferase [Candidatus Odyssella thessalonicensis]
MRIRTAVFPVAGLGTRFLPATKAIPKEMLTVGDKPLIQHAVEEAKAAGIERFIFITSQGKTAIEDHFDSNPLLERTLAERGNTKELEKVKSSQLSPGDAIFIRQQQPLGLGHAVWCTRHLVGNEPFALLLADDMIIGGAPCTAQMISAYEKLGRGNYTAVMDVEPLHVSRYGILDIESDDGWIVKAKHVIEKPAPHRSPSCTAIVGRYILDPMTFESINIHNLGICKEIQLTDAFYPMIQAGIPFYGVRFAGQRYDCGTKEGWLEANIANAFERNDLREKLLTTLKNLKIRE